MHRPRGRVRAPRVARGRLARIYRRPGRVVSWTLRERVGVVTVVLTAGSMARAFLVNAVQFFVYELVMRQLESGVVREDMRKEAI